MPALSAVPLPLDPPDISAACAPPLDEIIRRLQPRYHFATGAGHPPVFWEREPYVWQDEGNDRISRFVGLGAFGGPPSEGKKQRVSFTYYCIDHPSSNQQWFYAFSIAPNSIVNAASTTRPPNTSKNPFTDMIHMPRKREIPDMDDSGQNYIFGNNFQKPAKRARVGAYQFWFTVLLLTFFS